MAFSFGVYGGWGFTGKTATAGTIIQLVVPSVQNAYTRMTQLIYISLGTQHTLTILRPLAKTTLSASAAAAQAVINLTRDPGAYAANATADGKAVPSVADNVIAANDFLVIKRPDGTFHLGKVSSVATLAITLTANVSTGGFAAGTDVWFFGITTDTDPNTGLAHPFVSPPVSARTTYSDDQVGVLGGINKYDPLILNSDNATAAGIIDQVSVAYSSK